VEPALTTDRPVSHGLPFFWFQPEYVSDSLSVLVPFQVFPLQAGDLGNRERTVIAVLLRNTA
jgi:hypothetical protein